MHVQTGTYYLHPLTQADLCDKVAPLGGILERCQHPSPQAVPLEVHILRLLPSFHPFRASNGIECNRQSENGMFMVMHGALRPLPWQCCSNTRRGCRDRPRRPAVPASPRRWLRGCDNGLIDNDATFVCCDASDRFLLVWRLQGECPPRVFTTSRGFCGSAALPLIIRWQDITWHVSDFRSPQTTLCCLLS